LYLTGQIYGLSTVLLMALATLPPAVAFALILIFTRRRPRLSAGLSLTAVTLAALAAIVLLLRFWGLQTPLVFNLRWLNSGSWTIPFGYLLDPLSLLMLTVVAVICCLVQFYSLGYMSGDPGFARYYAFMSLFAWAMLSLTLSSGLLQLYIFWELVGLSSYLLIGFWYEKFSASQAGKKAFVMTRLGDVAFFLGLLFILLQVGNLDILELNRESTVARLGPMSVTLAALLIFGGIVGKSAQFPLLTWLPDAMEGPTPVSALLHSATMVAAGVYLFARLFPFFSHSSQAMTVFLAIGTLSMFSAATMAMISRDIKRVWAYSTISQLGYMIMALAAGGYAAGVFHLTTHAGFKALLFLCSGVFIHRFATNDMFEIGRRGGRQMKIPLITMLIAAAALSGIPPLSGFFSKEFILETLAELDNPFWLGMALAGVFLTAYYTFRLIFILVFARPDAADAAGSAVEVEEEKHGESKADAAMAAPLIVLATVTVGLGFALTPLKRHLGVDLGAAAAGAGHHGWITPLSLALVAAAVGLAWLEFGRRGAEQKGFAERLPALQRFFDQRWYLDHLYRFLLDVFVYRIFSGLCTANDRKVIDGSIDAFGRSTLRSGDLMSRLHTGMIQYRLLAIFAVMVMLGVYFIF
jgi:NADH-quinone oxidoreductase subunit L